MPLTVRLAGFNVDADLLSDVLDLLSTIDREGGSLSAATHSMDEYRSFVDAIASRVRSALPSDSFTPETLSAAYARISRDPRAVSELRRSARFGIARARKSNETIIFGLGHASVAEHACFNFDVAGLSRLAAEEIESHRLLSFTEKSQRYVTATSEFVIPAEALGTAWEATFREAAVSLFQTYDKLSADLLRHHVARLGHTPSPEEQRELENRAKEDARYVLPLACTTQMGATMNARNLEYVVRDLSDHPLAEARALGHGLHAAVAHLAPSLVKYTTRASYPRDNRREMASPRATRATATPLAVVGAPDVRVVDSTPDGERAILAGFAFTLGTVLNENDVRVWQKALKDIGPHDGPPREFELASVTFEACVSASCFAQLKRHRLMTLLTQPYDPALGIVMPPSVREAALEDEFTRVLNCSTETAERLSHEHPLLSPYILTNAHRRRVLMQLNARELYHLARLRCDEHAQWEIRLLARQMVALARALWPRAMALACGKHEFERCYSDFFAAQ